MILNVLRKCLFLLLAGSVTVVADTQTVAEACGSEPMAYKANYALTRKGRPAGSMQMILESKDTGTFSYRMDSRVRWGIVRPHIKQQSSFTLKNGIILPDSFRSVQKFGFYKRTESVDFNWESMQARGTKKHAKFELELQPGMQDKLSIYLLLAQVVCAGEFPVDADVVSGPILKPYSYRLLAIEPLDTSLGRLQTTHVRLGTPETEKQTDLWLAKETRFLPVKLVYRKKDDVTITNLVEISFADK